MARIGGLKADNAALALVVDPIIERPKPFRRNCCNAAGQKECIIGPRPLSCGNFEPGFASALVAANIAIVTGYNDMTSAHQPNGRYPEQTRAYAREIRVDAVGAELEAA